MRGMNNAMFDLMENPGLIHAVMEKGEAIAIEKGKLNIDMGMNILRLNDSVANMMVISPSHWREFIKPHMKAVCDELHSYSKDVKIYCHICGNVLPVIEDIAETGIDCIGPLDPMGGFTAEQARKRVGKSISLMGGVNTMSFVNSTQEEIIDEAREVMKGAGGEGGFVLGSGCVVPRSAKRENILALVDAAQEYGKYIDGRLENE
jgi:uroporphyrinogen-III decarboxylase